MRIIVVGCGRVGSQLAYRLWQQGHQVTVVDQARSNFDNLPPDFRGRTFEGEVLSQEVLRRAGIAEADGLAAVTNVDSINAVTAHLAQSVYHVPNVVARNYDPRWRPMLEAFGLQLVSSAAWGAQRIEELLYGSDFRTAYSAGNGEVEIYEFAVPEAWKGRSLGELLPREQCVPIAVTRAGKSVLAAPGTELQSGDLVLVGGTLDGVRALRAQLKRRKEA